MKTSALLRVLHAAHFARRQRLKRLPLPCQALLLTLLSTFAAMATAVEPAPSGEALVPVRAVFAEGRLWVLSERGQLASVTEAQEQAVLETFPEEATDLCVHNDHPLVVTSAQDSGTWTVRQHAAKAWTVVGALPTNGDRLLAMDCGADRITLLTTRRLVELRDSRQSAVALSETLYPGRIYSTYGTREQLFVGSNAGEWGGDLRRIDRSRGTLTDVLCGGRPNTPCDAVNAIIAEPGKPECIVAAAGVVHISAHGRVLEVCGDQVREVFSKAYVPQPPPGRDVVSLDSGGTIAFFGLIRAGNTLWAAGTDGLYHIAADGTARAIPLPPLRDVGGLRVGFLPELAVVLTTVNQRHSLSGAVPLIVPR